MRVELFVARVVATADSFVSQDYDIPPGLSLTPATCVTTTTSTSALVTTICCRHTSNPPATSTVDQRHVSWIVVVRLRQRTVSPLTFQCPLCCTVFLIAVNVPSAGERAVSPPLGQLPIVETNCRRADCNDCHRSAQERAVFCTTCYQGSWLNRGD